MAQKEFVYLRADAIIKQVSVTVAEGDSTGSSTADARLVGGMIIGYHDASGAGDMYMNSIVLNANGSVTVTLSGNTTAEKVFTVLVLK